MLRWIVRLSSSVLVTPLLCIRASSRPSQRECACFLFRDVRPSARSSCHNQSARTTGTAFVGRTSPATSLPCRTSELAVEETAWQRTACEACNLRYSSGKGTRLAKQALENPVPRGGQGSPNINGRAPLTPCQRLPSCPGPAYVQFGILRL